MSYVGIVGSREWKNLKAVDAVVDALPDGTTVVSGGARGVDRRAEKRARERGLDVLSFRPRESDRDLNKFHCYFIEVWENGHFSRTAGRVFAKFVNAAFYRNELIVKASDELVAFQRDGSHGTQNSIDYARINQVPVTLYEETSRAKTKQV